MRLWKKTSSSASEARLYLQGRTDKASGLRFTDRIFIPDGEVRPHKAVWFIFDVLLSCMVTLGLCWFLTSGFSIPVTLWYYPVLILANILVRLLFGYTRSLGEKTGSGSRAGKASAEKTGSVGRAGKASAQNTDSGGRAGKSSAENAGGESGAKNESEGISPRLLVLGIAFVLILLALFSLFIFQDQVQSGAKICYYQLRQTISATYGDQSQEELASSQTVSAAASVFLTYLGIAFALWLGFAMFIKEDFLLIAALYLPLLVLACICGGAKSVPAMFLLLFGLLGCYASTRTVRHKRLWGVGNQAIFEKNKSNFQKIQKKNIVLIMAASMILTIPGFYLVQPLLAVQLKPAETVAARIQSKFLSTILAALPSISANEWNLELETVGGGVSGGALQDEDGYKLEGVEDVKVTVSSEPEETIFLKGFVGSNYTGSSWEGGYETTFKASSFSWHVQGDAGLYVLNLPFLRTEYLIQKAGEDGAASSQLLQTIASYGAVPSEITVERINANDDYTYVPYGVYLNDYYQVENGDGSVAGQQVADDSFYFYYRDDYENILSLWEEADDTSNDMDQVENSYHAYCTNEYLEVADGLDQLREKVDQEIKDQGLDTEKDTEKIVSWVRAFLAENYEYDINVSALEEGQDFLTDFLFNSKKGYSIHFASAGVEMFRMFGIPARYVVGYEAPKSLFTVQPGGSYSATLQDDNAQAWAEIYVSGVGWEPVDLTPGVVGTLEEVGPGGEKISTYDHDESELAWDPDQDGSQEEEEGLSPATLMNKLTEKVNSLLNTQITVLQMVHFLELLLAFITITIILIFALRRYCRTYGYDPFGRRTLLERLLYMFAAYYKRLRAAGLPREADSGSEEFIAFASKRLPDKCNPDDVRYMRDLLYECCYGEMEPRGEDLLRMRKMMHVKKKPAD